MSDNSHQFQPEKWRHLTDDLLPRDAVIAIDGPAGSGKSTTAKALAKRFGLLYIDTGAMYRAITLAALTARVDLQDETALVALAANAQLELKTGKGEIGVFWDGQDVSQAIRAPEVDAAVSLVASHPGVRAIMVAHQQRLGRRGGVVMEGRDIGSVVFPLATSKIFLHADLEARVERRFRQNRERGHPVSREELTRDLAARDRQDSERSTSPLTISPDAHVIDSSAMSLQQQNDACALACLVNPALDAEVDRDPLTAKQGLGAKYRIGYGLFRAFGTFWGIKEYGNDGGPVPPGCILACNHISLWDPPLVGSTLRRQPVNSLAKAELFRIWPLGPLFRWLDSIPIRRKGYDREAFSSASEKLQAGHNLLIFPEGTRQPIGRPGKTRSGLGILVQATLAPMVPIFIRGSYGKTPLGSRLSPLEVNYGPIVRWHGLQAMLQTLDKKEVSRRIGNLCTAAYEELQARSFERTPQTAFEKKLGEQQARSFAKRHRKLFGGGVRKSAE
ncbi:hypothetical protein CSB20_11035 [bacterium DOLZORAL124_64_63]|nr:MAG: hypothetical protein CSB20_11035 [bacterium DOLZORAL124_64_63]